MKSKLLQPRSSGLNQSHDAVGGQRENIEDPSVPLEAPQNRTTRSNWLLTPRPLRKPNTHAAEDLLIEPRRPRLRLA
jgi:hypothetical protein